MNIKKIIKILLSNKKIYFVLITIIFIAFLVLIIGGFIDLDSEIMKGASIIGGVSFSIKSIIDFKYIKTQNIGNIEKQDIHRIGKQNIENVEHQYLNGTTLSKDEELLSEIKKVLDPINEHLLFRGGLGIPFISKPFDDLMIFIQGMDAVHYSFKKTKISLKWNEIKKNLTKFSDLYHRNVYVLERNTSFSLFKYYEMERDRWKKDTYVTNELLDEAYQELVEADKLLIELIKLYSEIVEITNKAYPH